MPGVSFLDGRIHDVGPGGLPIGGGLAPTDFDWLKWRFRTGAEERPVVLVHGFDYDPSARSLDNPHWQGAEGLGSFARWRRDLAPGRAPVLGFGWYSVPAGLRGLLRAWWNRRWMRYRYAWDLAEEAGQALAVMLRRLGGPVDVLCHSLGSRVVIQALAADLALPVKNIVFMNGAEFRKPAAVCARENSHVRFVNLVVPADDVLAKPPIGLEGLGPGAPTNWTDIALDDPEVQLWGARHGWHLQGDNPKKWADHWFTFRHQGNHGLIRAALAGEPLDPPPSVHSPA